MPDRTEHDRVTAELAIGGTLKPLRDRMKLPNQDAAVQHGRIQIFSVNLGCRIAARGDRPGHGPLRPLHLARRQFAARHWEAVRASPCHRRMQPGSASSSARKRARPGSARATTSSQSMAYRCRRKMPVTGPGAGNSRRGPGLRRDGNLLFGTDSLPFPLTVHSLDGSVHEITVTTGEEHIRKASSEKEFRRSS